MVSMKQFISNWMEGKWFRERQTDRLGTGRERGLVWGETLHTDLTGSKKR